MFEGRRSGLRCSLFFCFTSAQLWYSFENAMPTDCTRRRRSIFHNDVTVKVKRCVFVAVQSNRLIKDARGKIRNTRPQDILCVCFFCCNKNRANTTHIETRKHTRLTGYMSIRFPSNLKPNPRSIANASDLSGNRNTTELPPSSVTVLVASDSPTSGIRCLPHSV